MLEDLKKEHREGFGPQDLMRVSLFIALVLVLGSAVFFMQTCEDTTPIEQAEDGEYAILSSLGDPIDFGQRLRDHGADREINQFSQPAIDALRVELKEAVSGVGAVRVDPAGLIAANPADALGKVFEVEGIVTDLTREIWGEGGTQRLWSVMVQSDPDGEGEGPVIVGVYPAFASDLNEGAPRDEWIGGGARRRIEEGQRVIMRGIYLQRRVGTIGKTAFRDPTPVLYATAFRRVLDIDERVAPIADPSDADWGNIKDRYLNQTQKWDEAALYQVIQWARATGHDGIQDMIESGRLSWSEWDQDTFSTWEKEVRAKSTQKRPFTEGARGRLFRMSGLIADVTYEEWNSIPANRFGVDELFQLLMMSDHYGNVVIRNISPFPLDTFTDIKGEKTEHVNMYGFFLKNHTYLRRQTNEAGTGNQPLTVPMFIVVHVERVPTLEAVGQGELIWGIAIVLIVMGILFYVVLIRGERKQAKRMEEHRIRLRKRMRAVEATKGAEGAEGASAGDGD